MASRQAPLDPRGRPPKSLLGPRAVPGWGDRVFPIALSGVGAPNPRGRGPPGASTNLPQLVAGLRAGVDLVDLAEDPTFEEDRFALPAMLGARRRPLHVLVPPRDPRRRWGPDPRDPGGDPRIVEVPVYAMDDPDRPHHASEVPSGSGWAVDLPSPQADEEEVERALEEGASLVRVPGTLLDAEGWLSLARSLPPKRGALVVVDPYGQGRFDGRFLVPSAPFGVSPSPGAEAELRARFQPVLRYGFLPIPRRRTLAQASLRFLLGIRRVAAVALPADRAEVLQEALTIDRTPGLTPRDRRKIRSLSRGPPVPARGGAAGISRPAVVDRGRDARGR